MLFTQGEPTNPTKKALTLGVLTNPTKEAIIGEKLLCNIINVILGPLRRFLAAFWKVQIFWNDRHFFCVLKNFDELLFCTSTMD